HGYGVYSARYGNIYFVRQLLQLAQEALSGAVREDIAWRRGDRWFDALRPAVEPEGLASPAHVARQRGEHIVAVRSVLTESDVLVFTLGLTEGWEDIESGVIYPTAPGTIAGDYDPERYRFHNFDVSEIVADFKEFRTLVRTVNPGIKFLLTVSPVPLAATATDDNVLAATTYSKAVLRAAAGMLASEFDDIDYFPSYEIVTCHAPGNEPFDQT
ncbi:GSCFA domain-containing protein, partial [Pseudomonas sp. BGM005]|nr:GSCFA domain-containing protein [Pseudomonas sp. BG5]